LNRDSVGELFYKFELSKYNEGSSWVEVALNRDWAETAQIKQVLLNWAWARLNKYFSRNGL